jgi:hypothetical protein
MFVSLLSSPLCALMSALWDGDRDRQQKQTRGWSGSSKSMALMRIRSKVSRVKSVRVSIAEHEYVDHCLLAYSLCRSERLGCGGREQGIS